MADEEAPKRRRGPIRPGEMRESLGASPFEPQQPTMLMSTAEQNILNDFITELKRSTDSIKLISESIKEAAESIASLKGAVGKGRVRNTSEPPPTPLSMTGNPLTAAAMAGYMAVEPDLLNNYTRWMENPSASPEPTPPQAPTPPGHVDMPAENPDLIKLRDRASIIGSERAERAAIIPPFGTMTPQSMLTIGSEKLAKLGFEHHIDDKGNVAPVFTQGGENVRRDEKGNILNAISADAEGAAPAMRSGGMLGSLAPSLIGASGMMGTMAEVIPTGFAAMTVARTIQNAVNMAYAPSRAGMQMGYAPGLTGAGASNYVGSIWDAMSESKFGFNPYMGFGDAMAINSEIQRLGYRGDTRSQMFGMFAGLQEHTGLTSTDTGGMLDQSFRYGGTSIQQFIQAMEQIPAAAQAANMNVSAFTQQLQQVSAELAQRSGLSPTQISLGITAASTATGLTPGAVGTLANNDYLTIMGAAASGENLGRYLGDAVQRASWQSGAGVDQMFKTFTGRNISELATNQQLQDLVRMQLWTNPQLFAGLNFQQLMQYANDPNRSTRLGATAGLSEIQRQASTQAAGTGDALFKGQDVNSPGVRQSINDQIVHQLTNAGVKSSAIQDLVANYGKDTQNSTRDIANEIRLAQQLVGQKTSKARDQANVKSTVEINLSGEASRILKATLKNQSYDTSNATNTGSGYDWSGAIVGGAQTLAHVGETLAPTLLTGGLL